MVSHIGVSDIQRLVNEVGGLPRPQPDGTFKGSTLYGIAQMHAEVESAKPHGAMQKLLAY